MKAVFISSNLNYTQPTLSVKIVDSFISADDCRLVYGHQADRRPNYYYQNYQYMTKCGDPFENKIMTQRIRTKDTTSSQNTAGESVIKVTACNMYSACADGEIQLSGNTFKIGDEGEIRLETYGDWYSQPLFMKANLVRAVYYNSLQPTFSRTKIINWLLSGYQNCLERKATSCHQGNSFPYIVESYYLAAHDPAI